MSDDTAARAGEPVTTLCTMKVLLSLWNKVPDVDIEVLSDSYGDNDPCILINQDKQSIHVPPEMVTHLIHALNVVSRAIERGDVYDAAATPPQGK